MTTPASVLCLDFDGVVCDSADEVAVTAWKHARQLWPELLPGDDWRPFLAPLRALRPAIRTGYEQTLMARLLAEGAAAAEIPARWPALLPACMERWGLERAAMIAGFGAVRDDWIARDPEGWLAQHRFFAPVVERLRMTARPVFVITTKQARFCERLLRHAGCEVAPGQLFGLEAGEKTDILAALTTRDDLSGAGFAFVEDSPEALERVAADPRLGQVGLYLADWGHNTEAMRLRVAANPRIRVLSLDELPSLV